MRLDRIAQLSFVFALVTLSMNLAAKDAASLYVDYCSGCHGRDLSGGSAASLLDHEWQFGGSPTQIAQTIKAGVVDAGMPSFGAVLNDDLIRSLVIYIQEQVSYNSSLSSATKSATTPAASEKEEFKIEHLVNISGTPWGMDFLPDGSLLITERGGRLYHYQSDKLSEIQGAPEVWSYGQGGLLDIKLHPKYAKNGWIYMSLSEGSLIKGGMTKVLRGKIVDGAWVEEQTIYSSDEKHYTNRRVHFGSRIVFKDGYLFFSVGDRGRQDDAQDLSKPNGKVHRLHDDGRVPDDNPFVGNKKALDTIWSYGHRNPQGMAMDPKTGIIWETEHGPRGGDELNTIEKGKNYGWPTITYGMNYNGTPITSETHRPGMEQPKHYWVPSIATAGIDVYRGQAFPSWSGKVLATGLVSQGLHLMSVDGEKVISEEVLFSDKGRVRDVAVGPDAYVYVLLNTRGGKGSLVRLRPL